MPTPNIKRILILQNKALRITNFAPFRSQVNPLYKMNNILKIADIVQLQNFLFAHDYFHNKLPATFNNIFINVGNVHSYETRGSKKHQISLPRARTQAYGINSIKYKTVTFWNEMVMELTKFDLPLKRKSLCKNVITKYFLETWWWYSKRNGENRNLKKKMFLLNICSIIISQPIVKIWV